MPLYNTRYDDHICSFLAETTHIIIRCMQLKIDNLDRNIKNHKKLNVDINIKIQELKADIIKEIELTGENDVLII